MVAEKCAAVTTEFENVPADILRAQQATSSGPSERRRRRQPRRIASSKKAFLQRQRIATAEWWPIHAADDLARGWTAIGARTGVIKTARMGYDGKGQEMVESAEQLASAWHRLGKIPCILERRVALDSEVSVMVARAADGEMVTWPVAENVHRNGILHTTVVPASSPMRRG